MASSSQNQETILDRLAAHCQTQPDRLAYRFLREDAAADTRSFAELDRRVRGLAAQLRERAAPDERALLLYPPGLEFVDAFLACLAAGIIAVPAFPPRRNRNAERLRAIVEDARPRLLLTTRQLLPTVEASELGNVSGLVCLATDDLSGEAGNHGPLPNISGDTIALLQYTSGSTGTPRGVVVTHKNLTANELAIQAAFRHTRDSVGVNWLPVFHDMGLIGNVLQPLFVGFPSILLAPDSFVREPVLWLRAITKYRATTAGAPNFGYEHCVRNITEEQKQDLDLGSWTVAYNGAEPVRAETLDRFTESFGGCGFRREAFFPCYGLAEATLFVSGGPPSEQPRLRCVQPSALEAGRVEAVESDGRWLVSSGRRAEGTKVVAVDPATRTAVPEACVGELWVSSPGIAAGYWNREEETRSAFSNYLASGEGPFLNTGDLGSSDGDEVYVTGRSKDLIVIRGRNIYPQDVEAAIERVLPFVEANSCAAFGIEGNGREHLGLVIEADRELVRIARTAAEGNGKAEAAIAELSVTVGKVRQVVGDEFEVPVQSVAFVRPGSFPRTSSGKVQRRACRNELQSGTLDVIHAWRECLYTKPASQTGSYEDTAATEIELIDSKGELLHAERQPITRSGTNTLPPSDGHPLDDVRRDQQKRYALAILVMPLAGMLTLVGLLQGSWVTYTDLILLVGMYFFTFMGITVGFHRLFTHQAFKTTRLVRLILGLAGTMAGEGALIFWVAAHRRHHQYSDREGDPHSPHLYGDRYWGGLPGLWHAHWAWMYRYEITDTSAYARDLLRDPSLRWITKMYIWITLVGLLIPAGIAGILAESWLAAARGLFWGGFLRMFLAHHFTWSVNSLCHAFGQHDHDTGDQSRNNIWLAVPTLGEAWHNNHHDAPSAASFCRHWWQVDIGAGVIRCLELLGLAWDVKEVKWTPRAATTAAEPLAMARVAPDDSNFNGPVETWIVDSAKCDIKNTISAAVVGWLRAEGNQSIEGIDPDLPMTAAGLDSMGAAVVALELEKATGVKLSADSIYQYPTVNRLADYISCRLALVQPAASVNTEVSVKARFTMPASTDAQDPLCGSMAEFANPTGSALGERVADYYTWRRLRREAGVWPFYRLARSPAAPSTAVSSEDGTSRQCINFASQDYLGLARDPRVVRQVRQTIDEYGVHSAGSPVLLGTTVPMADLERTLAGALEKEDCLAFPTGWAAGFGVITGLVRAHDTLVLDALCHRCLMEGAYHVSREPLLFRHNDLDHLGQTLRAARERDPNNGLFVVVESLYSMDSDSPDLPAMLRLVRDFGAVLILDVAHDFGAMGGRGLGLLEQLDGTGLAVDVVMGSFSKTFAATGGFVAADQPVTDYLRGHTTSFVYSNAISPVQAAAALACCKIAFSPEGQQLRFRLNENVSALRSAMQATGCRVEGAPSPIVPVFVGGEPEARLTARAIARNGLLANLVEYPAVPRGKARFRFQVMSSHTHEAIAQAAKIMAESRSAAAEELTAG
jgi:acyl-CoA synthetase (AMP-forming)/AMP-acid ligase II/7-keto-8-aminopelargonate synthetase-like enzyme/fatty-acid desaturase/acyl carrier protein